MFESLKAKMKGLFSKGEKLKEEDVYKHEETEHVPEPEAPIQPSQPKAEETQAVPEPVAQPEPVKAEAAPEPPAEEPKLSS